MPNMAATPMTKWKCPTTKYVPCKYVSIDGCARKKPLMPPLTNTETNPTPGASQEPPDHRASRSRAALFKGRVSSRVILRGEDALSRLCQGSDRNMSGSGLSAVQSRERPPKRRESGAPQREPTNPQPGAGNQRVRHVETAIREHEVPHLDPP